MLVESVYFPALAAMLFDACTTNPRVKSVLLKQAAAYAKSLRPLELFGESTCHESVERVVEVLCIFQSPNSNHPVNKAHPAHFFCSILKIANLSQFC
jgi:hypothetical protein